MKVSTRIYQEVKNVLYQIQVFVSSIPSKTDFSVPYVCQFSTPANAELSLKGQLALADDPNWKETGASSSEQYAQWARVMCGMACTLMVLKYFKKEDVKIVPLSEDALQNGVYSKNGYDISSMKYKEFAQWIKKYNLRADIYTRLSLQGIRVALSKGKLVMVSVNPNIREYETASVDQKGGHLVLVTGYDIRDNTLTINNPSGFLSTDTQTHHIIPTDKFRKYYAGRGITIGSEIIK